MSTFLPAEKGTTIRMPSTANLMIDSADRDQARFVEPADFFINKNQSILNGYFTRIGLTEHVVEWNYPNINNDLGTDTLTMDVSGSGAITVTVLSGFYTVEELLDAIVARANVVLGSTVFSIGSTPFGSSLDATAFFRVTGGNMATLLLPSIELPTAYTRALSILAPDLRPFRYLDFVSERLTYNQDLKDDSTNTVNRTVLTRWYMAWDSEPMLDGYGYPILMGYTPFALRRAYNPPKQVRWDNTQPIGQLDFQVYVDPVAAEVYDLPMGKLVTPTWSANWDWLMTLQVSEV